MGRFSFSIPSNLLTKAFVVVALWAAGLAAQPANTILAERWDGITGTLVTDLTSNANYPDNPSSRSYPTIYELPTNTADNYGTRTRGYITPPTTGSYTFWIASDDASELWLGTSSDPATARLIASVPSWTNSREWTKFTQQQSVAITLTAGTTYYIETRHKEGTGGDALAVGWQGPGITGETERPIPGTRLSPFVLTTPVAKTILQERWDGISGGTVSSLTSNSNYPNNPSSRSYLALYEMAQNTGDNYGTRTRGYITPPTTGSYTFWIAGDDNAELWLGTSSDPATARLIASAPTWTNSREWTKFTQQQSAAIALTAGTRYYIETRLKENTGNDNMAVGWQGPGITGEAERPIPGIRLSPLLLGAAPSILTPPSNQTVNVGQTATFTVTATGLAPLTYQWYRNEGPISGATAATYTTPPATSGDDATDYMVIVTNSIGTTSGNALLSVRSPPVITIPPASIAVNPGQTATFSVASSGTIPFTYQWQKNGANIAGATSQTYTTPATTASDNGAQFTVTVSNPAGSAASAAATLSVNAPPTIITQPSNVTVNAGQSASFIVIATNPGMSPPTYQWRKNGVNILGETSSSYLFRNVTSADNGTLISVVVSNPAGSVISNNALLTVNSAPIITVQPVSITVTQGESAAFFVTATGSPAPTYQWRRNGVAIAGATSPTYFASSAPSENGAQFTVVVSNSLGSVTSNVAVLTVLFAPTISLPPASQTVMTGQTATFTVTASGSAPLTYQWRKNGADIAGATAQTYTTPVLTSADNGARYAVAVSNSIASVTSSDAVLTVVFVATNSRKLAVSGELVDASGNPLGYPTPVTVDAIVNLYNDSTAGTSLYTEAFRANVAKGIRVSNGLFVARLGEGTTTQNLQQVISANANLWVEVTIDDGTPDILRPRTPLTAAPYSLGGTPPPALAPSIAPSLSGNGDPNSLAIDGQIGATYVNSVDNSTWFKLKSAWKRLD